jgi:hypothetical protein
MVKRIANVLFASFALTVALVVAGYVVTIFLVNYRVADAFWLTGWATVALWLPSSLVCWKYLKPH